MEREFFNDTQKLEKGSISADLERKFSEISFTPSSHGKDITPSANGLLEKYAVIGLVAGVIAIFSWIVIMIGVLAAIIGIIFSVLGLKSANPKYARIGLGLSVVGLISSVLYFLAVYNSMINYDYFTNEFWGTASDVEVVAK